METANGEFGLSAYSCRASLMRTVWLWPLPATFPLHIAAGNFARKMKELCVFPRDLPRQSTLDREWKLEQPFKIRGRDITPIHRRVPGYITYRQSPRLWEADLRSPARAAENFYPSAIAVFVLSNSDQPARSAKNGGDPT